MTMNKAEKAQMPELPNPGGSGWAYADRCRYSENDMLAYARTAVSEALERAAKECERMRDVTLNAQMGSPDDLSNIQLRQIAYLGHNACADAIRAMDGKE